MFDKPCRSQTIVQRHLSSPLLQGHERKSHRPLRTRTNKTREALVRRPKTNDLLVEPLTLDQLCGVRSDNAPAGIACRARTPHNEDRHKRAPCGGNTWITCCSGRRQTSKNKLFDFRTYSNNHRTHNSLEGRTPDTPTSRPPANLRSFRWQPDCRALYQTPVAA